VLLQQHFKLAASCAGTAAVPVHGMDMAASMHPVPESDVSRGSVLIELCKCCVVCYPSQFQSFPVHCCHLQVIHACICH
jgi:hypothetical protein